MMSSLIKLVTVAVVASIGAQDGTKDLSSLSAPYKGRKSLLLSILIYRLVINTIDSIVRGLETSHVSASLTVGTPRFIVNTY